ncbi:MAG: hypothetical protein LBR19_09920, partial [Bifidobacteriaceae bacterium]|nr:hypothetical protein [Bifidobacteriaceae bacterium]
MSASGPLRPQEQAAVDAFRDRQNEAIHKGASAWRLGVTAVLTLAGGGVGLSARSTLAAASTAWRATTAVILAAGVLLGVVSLIIALTAESGAGHGSVSDQALMELGGPRAAETRQAAQVAARVRRSQHWAIAAALALVTALTLVLVAPSAKPKLVVYHDGTKTCGSVLSADQGVLRLG